MKTRMFRPGPVRDFSSIFTGVSSSSVLPPNRDTDPGFGISVKSRAEPAGQTDSSEKFAREVRRILSIIRTWFFCTKCRLISTVNRKALPKPEKRKHMKRKIKNISSIFTRDFSHSLRAYVIQAHVLGQASIQQHSCHILAVFATNFEELHHATKLVSNPWRDSVIEVRNTNNVCHLIYTGNRWDPEIRRIPGTSGRSDLTKHTSMCSGDAS